MARRGGGATPIVGVVTDSTACLPPDLVASDLLRVVPLNVTIGEVTRAEDALDGDEVAQAQAQGITVTTSRPSPMRFLDSYRELASQGCSSIVSVHASEALSSTVSSARLAAMESEVPVEVLDSRTLGMALGFGALSALAWARAGHDLDDVAAAARATCESSTTAFFVDSLEHLRRGGRIGRAGAILGSALSIKPLLQVADGRIAPLARVRSRNKALERLGSWALTRAECLDAPRACAVHSLDQAGTDEHAERLASLTEQLRGGHDASRSAGDDPDDDKPGGADERAGRDEHSGAKPGGDDGPDATRIDPQTADDLAESASSQESTGEEHAVWAMGPVSAPLGAVVTAHVGAGAVGVVVASMSPPPSGEKPVHNR